MCLHPIQGWRSRTVNASGKRSIVFDLHAGYADMPVDVPCGQCIECRLERSRQWAIRCMHEAQMHDDNCFLTLTYDDDNLPWDGGLHVEHYQNFMKRFRKAIAPQKIRFFHCGEYGEQLSRPHYHACIFGYDFPDKEILKEVNGVRLYTSDLLADLWPYGFSTIGAVTFESAAYVARYVTKKITGKAADQIGPNGLRPYEAVDPDTGEIVARRPEYITMSRRPGIGRPWFDKFGSDVYPADEVIVNSKSVKPPKYYDEIYDKIDPADYARIKGARAASANARTADLRAIDYKARSVIVESRFSQLGRSYERLD